MFFLSKLINNQNQAVKNSNPPIGVINPKGLKLKGRKSFNAKKYKDPEKRTIPDKTAK